MMSYINKRIFEVQYIVKDCVITYNNDEVKTHATHINFKSIKKIHIASL